MGMIKIYSILMTMTSLQGFYLNVFEILVYIFYDK